MPKSLAVETFQAEEDSNSNKFDKKMKNWVAALLRFNQDLNEKIFTDRARCQCYETFFLLLSLQICWGQSYKTILT
jgi:hypothetical protein